MGVELSIVNFGLGILIWIVQLIIYPSFQAIEASRFQAWHKIYTRRIACLVIPLMLSQVALLGRVVQVNNFALLSVVQGLFILGAWIVTFFISVPCHQKLSLGKDEKQIRRLIRTNWLRTAAWTVVPVLDLIDPL